MRENRSGRGWGPFWVALIVVAGLVWPVAAAKKAPGAAAQKVAGTAAKRAPAAAPEPEPPPGTGPVWVEVETWTAKGRASLAAGRHEEAIEMFSRAIAKHSRAGEAYLGRGQAHEAMENFGAAKRDYSKVLELNPRSPMALSLRGLANRRLGRYEEAVGDLKAVLEILPDNACTWIDLGDVYLDQKQYAAARQALERAATLDPGYTGLREAQERLAAAGPPPPGDPALLPPVRPVADPVPFPEPPSPTGPTGQSPANPDSGPGPAGPVDAGPVWLADEFRRPDADSPGPGWQEFTCDGTCINAGDTPWQIRHSSLLAEVQGGGGAGQGFFAVSVASFPATGVRIEFELRRAASGPCRDWFFQCWLIPPPRQFWPDTLRTVLGFRLGLAANGAVGGSLDFLAGEDAPRAWAGDHGFPSPTASPTRVVMTIAAGHIEVDTGMVPVMRVPLAVAPDPGLSCHLAFGLWCGSPEGRATLGIRRLLIQPWP
ncbi:MAG: tetratricopeptide repeat protein [Candidatus Riflebacteria bacterium]|nr:tetratricopeptide repeat protein [Candidatus Riflebacteria bacterium]